MDLSNKILVFLEDVYIHIPGLRSSTIIDLSEGSVVCTYSLSVSAYLYRTLGAYNVTMEKINEAQELLESRRSVANIGELSVNYVNRHRKTEFAQALRDSQSPCNATDICPFGYTCLHTSEETTCVHMCTTDNPCQNGGTCYVNEQNFVGCKCKSDSDLVYFGDYCESSDERLALEKKYIIIIACVSGAILILILVFISCICFRKRPFDRGEYSFQSNGFGCNNKNRLCSFSKSTY